MHFKSQVDLFFLNCSKINILLQLNTLHTMSQIAFLPEYPHSPAKSNIFREKNVFCGINFLKQLLYLYYYSFPFLLYTLSLLNTVVWTTVYSNCRYSAYSIKKTKICTFLFWWWFVNSCMLARYTST